jgi:hypothetical protein
VQYCQEHGIALEDEADETATGAGL